MKENIISLVRGGSNHTSLEKMNPLTVRIYDVNTRRVVTHFIDICCITGPRTGSAESIFSKIDEVFAKTGNSVVQLCRIFRG